MKVSIVVPVFNERSFLTELFREIERVQWEGGVELEVVAIDDGSTDGSRQLLKLLDQLKYKIHHFANNQGKGAALRKGFELATGDIIAIQDADLECSPKEFPKLIERLLETDNTVVYGSRLLKPGNRMKLQYRIANFILTLLVYCLHGKWLSDVGTVHKVFRREVLDEIDLRCKGFEFCAEFTSQVLSRGYDIVELPIAYRARSKKEGKKIRFGDAFIIYSTLITTWFKTRRWRLNCLL